MPVMDGNGPAPWKTGQNHVLGTHTRTRTRERAERVHVKNWPTPIVDGNGPVPWKTCENYILGTNTHMDPYTDP